MEDWQISNWKLLNKLVSIKHTYMYVATGKPSFQLMEALRGNTHVVKREVMLPHCRHKPSCVTYTT